MHAHAGVFLLIAENKMERAVIFIDGNNFYHGMKELGLPSTELHYEKLSRKLVLNREWKETRYYIGQVRQEGDLTRYAHQRRFLHVLQQFENVRCFKGRVENRPAERTAKELTRWLNALSDRENVSISGELIGELRKIAEKKTVQYVEKAVDVMIATDMVSMAYKKEYDVAYLLSADGDFTPAVNEVRKIGSKVFVASPIEGYQISRVANTFIRLDRDFFHGCWA